MGHRPARRTGTGHQVEIKDTELEARLGFETDARGNPTAFVVRDCRARIEIKDVDVKGDGLGGVLERFVDGFH